MSPDLAGDPAARRLALAVCARAHGRDDAVMLLDMLGLVPYQLSSRKLSLANHRPMPDRGHADSRADTGLPSKVDDKPAARPAAVEVTPARCARPGEHTPCVDCGRPTIAWTQWRHMTGTEKQGRALRATHDQCSACYARRKYQRNHRAQARIGRPQTPRTPCVDCGRPTLPPRRLATMTAQERAGVARRAAHGMCAACWLRAKQAGTLPHPASIRSAPADPAAAQPTPEPVTEPTFDVEALSSLINCACGRLAVAHGQCGECLAKPASETDADPVDVVDLDELAASETEVVAADMCAQDIAGHVALGWTLTAHHDRSGTGDTSPRAGRTADHGGNAA